MDPAKDWRHHQSQSCPKVNEQAGDSFCGQKAQIRTKRCGLWFFHLYPNVLKRQFSASCPNQKWVTDVTYIHTRQGWAFLSLIKDLHDGFIVAHCLTRQNSHELVMRTVKLAHQKEMVTDGLILHSDQGYQYTSQSYFALTKEYNITPSMSRRCTRSIHMRLFRGHVRVILINILGRGEIVQCLMRTDLVVNAFPFV